MSRYEWPGGGGRAPKGARSGRAAARRAFNLSLNAGADPAAIAEARALRHRSAQQPAPGPAAAPPAGGPGADRDLWLPAGPAVMLRGLPETSLRVAGRIRDIAVSANGQRAYAASALGGVWYTDTAGAQWEPVGPWAMVTAFANVTAAANTLTCGAIHVRFDPAGNDPANDDVWVGTGEVGSPRFAPFDIGVMGQYAGVGVLHGVGPVPATRASPLVDPWTREAQPRTAPNAYVGLRDAGICSFAADPASPGSVVAATTRGLHHNQTGPAADPWVLITVAAWDAISAGASGRVAVTDVVWTPATVGAGAHPARLWVSIVDTVAPALNGVWVSTAGVAGPFVQIAIAGMNAVQRPTLAADPAFPDVVYVFGSGPRLWRIDGVVPATVAPLPATMFGAGGGDQSDYDVAVALDPTNVNRVIVGGADAVVPGTTDPAAALYRLTVGGAAPAYNTDYVTGNASSPRWIGAGVHADVHRVRWRRVGADDHIWVCCDGGVFRSTAAGAPATFVSRSTGLAVTEAGSVASHPISDGLMLTGVQDNGAQLRIGESIWTRVANTGDAGGAAFDPGTTGRFAVQLFRSDWNDDGTLSGGISPARRRTAMTAAPTGDSPALVVEDGASRFYSNAAVVRRADGVTQLAVGTNRVWYSERWGQSRWDGTPPGRWRRNWTTLPSNTDPRAGNANNSATDLVPSGPFPAGASSELTTVTGVRALKWAGADRLYTVLPGAIHRFDRNPPNNGAWARTNIVTRPAPPAVAVAPAWPAAGAANLPDIGAMNDLAVHDPAAGPHGSFYVATSHPLEPIWWFDGNALWEPARLGTTAVAPVGGAAPALPPNGIRAPAYAVVVDPDNPRIVYVGTTVGVWRGEFTAPGAAGAPPTWVWRPFNSGLPEAAVQDLTMTTWPRPAGGPLKLLRAALQSRGIWEVAPDVDTPPATYARVHPYDTRRITPTDQRDPMWSTALPQRDWTLDWADRRNRDFRTAAGQPAPAPDATPVGSFHWHGSPDIRLRPAQGGAAVPPGPGLPWTNANQPTDRFWLWSLQTALRTIDPLVVPDGRWTRAWRARLAAIRVGLGMSNAALVNAALWNHAQVQAGFWADPWADGGPTEADLIERIVGAATPRVGGVNSRATSPASLAVLRRQYRVDVCLHHRGREPVAPASALVILLQIGLPANPAVWGTQPLIVLPAAGPPLNALHAALNAIPAGGGPVPAQLVLPGGWAAADVVLAIRRPTQAAATGSPPIVTFTVDYSAAAARTQFLLLALVHSAVDPLALTGATLRDMILGSRHAAARSIEVS